MFHRSEGRSGACAAIALALILLACAGCRKTENFRGAVMPADMPIVDFTLTDQNNQPFTLSRQQGKVVLLFFGYTYCPDVCPMTLSAWKQVQGALGDDARNVRFVYVTVDPKRDTLERLKSHLEIFSDDFIGLTGSEKALNEVYSKFGVFREIEKFADSETDYLVNHTARIFVFDRDGRWRLGISYNAPVEDIVHDIRLLLE